jgi:hypothetical protein
MVVLLKKLNDAPVNKISVKCMECNNCESCICFEYKYMCYSCFDKNELNILTNFTCPCPCPCPNKSCKSCTYNIKKLNDYVDNKIIYDCLYCELCGNLSLEEDIKNCDDCDKKSCMNCSSLVWTQSETTLCKNCFIFECAFCTEKIDKSRIYVADLSYTEEYFPICNNCLKNDQCKNRDNKYF